MFKKLTLPLLLAGLFSSNIAHAGIDIIAKGYFDANTSDLSGLNNNLESGVAANLLGGLGSGLAYAGGNTFIATPDRGPNALGYNSAIDDTTSYIDRFHTLQLNIPDTINLSAGAIYNFAPTLSNTTLMYSGSPLNYGTGAGLGIGSGAPAQNTADKNYFTGRSDNYLPGSSTNINNARFDPEGIRVSNDGKSIFVTDEYGPYVYQFNRSTGERIKTFTLPSYYGVNNQNPVSATEISGNTQGRVANKGMEGLAITPDGTKLIGMMQSPLIQDGGTKGTTSRIVVIDIATGVTKEIPYKLENKNNTISEVVAINDHQFLVDERDGGNNTFKKLYTIDINQAGVSNITGQATLGAVTTPSKTLVLDLLAKNADGTSKYGLWQGTNAADPVNGLPSKIEGLAFGKDVLVNGVLKHTLIIANDNDFINDNTKPVNKNYFYVFGIDGTATTLVGDSGFTATYTPQDIAAVPLPTSALLMSGGLLGLMGLRRRKM